MATTIMSSIRVKPLLFFIFKETQLVDIVNFKQTSGQPPQ
jgi:hypothetical protein